MPLHHAPALQAAPGQWPGSSPGTNSPLDCLCPGSALAIERVQTNAAGQVVLKLKTPWRDGTTHLVLRRDTDSPVDCLCQPKGSSSARARPARLSPLEFSTARRVRGDVRPSPPGAAELGQVAQAGVRDRHGALPELRRRTEDRRGDPRATGHREDPHAPGSAGPGAAACASPSVATASGLTVAIPRQSGGPDAGAAEIGCATASQS